MLNSNYGSILYHIWGIATDWLKITDIPHHKATADSNQIELLEFRLVLRILEQQCYWVMNEFRQ